MFLEGWPPRAPGFQYEAIHETIALQPGNYSVVGEHSGPITIDQITVVNDAVKLGEVATGNITLHFDAPLPDDRYTLVVKDSLVDPARRPLDGDTNSLAPVSEDEFISGNGVPGGDFIGNFTVDTRVEIGTFYAGSFWIDLNADGTFDPDNPNPRNRDVVYQFGDNEGLVDRPIIGDWDGDGFDEVGLYALDPSSGIYNFQLDKNSNGLFDPGTDEGDDPEEFPLELTAGAAGYPVAGNFDDDDQGIDEVGLLVTGEWLLDDDFSITFKVPGLERPLVGDFDADFDDNVGLLIANTIEASPGLIAQWLLDVGDPNANPLMFKAKDTVMSDVDFSVFTETGNPGEGLFQPSPTGHITRPLVYQDVFYEVGDARFAPFSGNFDLPSTRVNEEPDPGDMGGGAGGGGAGGGGAGGGDPANPLHNEMLPPDVNGDGIVTADDAIVLSDFLSGQDPPIVPIDGLSNPGNFFADVDNDRMVTPQDYLAVIGFLQSGGGGEAGDPEPMPVVGLSEDVGYFTNHMLRRDANLDGVVAPVDALVIANHINAYGSQSDTQVPFNEVFVDPNGDRYVAPSDFLFIVNQLIAESAAGEGESVVDEVAAAGPALIQDVVLETTTQLEQAKDGECLVNMPAGLTSSELPTTAPGAPSVGPQVVINPDEEEDDDMDDLLELLASNVGEAWSEAP